MQRLKQPALRGDREVVTATVRNPDGAARNLTGEVVEFYARRSIKDASPLIFKTNATPGGGVTVLDQAAHTGKVEVEITATDLGTIAHNQVLVCALRVVDALGRPSTTPLEIVVELTAAG